MNVVLERITLPPGQTLRLFRWHRSVATIEVISSNGVSTVAKGEGTHWHYHPEMELTLFRTGTASRFIGDQVTRFSAPDLVLIGSGVPHYWYADASTSGISLQWNFLDQHPLWSLSEFAELTALQRLADRGIRIIGSTGSLVQQVMGDLEHSRGVARLGCFFRILGYLGSAPPADLQPLATRPYSLHNAAGNTVGIRRALHYALAHFREETHLKEVIGLTGMTKATFSRQFKQHFGWSYTDFVNHLRLQAACRDLSETEKPITEIAYESGFGQLTFFYRFFRREIGSTPKAFRAAKQAVAGANVTDGT
jgi:AraC-like DNA-binding protein/mannose-6-phosphate isomerase-like protein (cupin superfamily)